MALNVKLAAKNRGFMMKDLAEKLGINATSLTRMLDKNGNPSMTSLYRICEVLDCKIEDLFDEFPTPPAPAQDAPLLTQQITDDCITCPHCGKMIHLSASKAEI